MGFGDWFSDSIASPIYHGAGNVKDGIGDLWNDATGKTASREASRAQVTATDKATAVEKSMFDKNVELNEPWRQAGLTALSDLSGGIKSGAFDYTPEQFKNPGQYAGPQEYKDPGFKFDFQADPGYQFRQQQQQQAIERSAAAGGGLFSGATLSDLAKKSGQMASDEYGAAYGRARSGYEADRSYGRGNFEDDRNFGQTNFNNTRSFNYGVFGDAQNARRQSINDRFSRLSTLAGLGEAGTARTGTAATMYGQQAGDNAIGAGNAKAAGFVGGYNTQRDTVMGLGGLATKIAAVGGA